MPYSCRQRAMICQYERSMAQLRASASQFALSDSNMLSLDWWEDETMRQLTLQCQAMRRQLPKDYTATTDAVTVSLGF